MRSNFIFLCFTCLVSTVTVESRLYVRYKWNFFDWTNPDVPVIGKPYIRGNALATDVDIDRFGRIFMASPQWREGMPVTLSCLTNMEGPGGPLLTPYPDWSWHNYNDCNNIISVFRTAIDECNRLWFVDTGQEGSTSLCPMKIMIFDLTTDTLIHKYIIPSNQAWDGTNLITPIVEIASTCLDAYLYIADVKAHGILTYDLRNNRSWRLNNTRSNAFGYDPEAEKMTVAGESVQLTDGIFGMSLSPKGFFENRYLYFNSLSSFYEKVIDVNSLKLNQYREPTIYRSIQRRSSQAGTQAISRTGAMFFPLQEETAVACWNIENPFTSKYIEVIAQDENALQYTSGIKVIVNDAGREELWLVSNRFPKFRNEKMKMNEVNLRLIYGFVDELIMNTRCAPRYLAGSHPDVSSWTRI